MSRKPLPIPLNQNREYTHSNSISFIRHEIERCAQEIQRIDTMHLDPAVTSQRDYQNIRHRSFTRREYLAAAMRGYKKNLTRLESEILLDNIGVEPDDFRSAVKALYQFLGRRYEGLAEDEREAYIACSRWLQAYEVIP